MQCNNRELLIVFEDSAQHVHTIILLITSLRYTEFGHKKIYNGVHQVKISLTETKS